MHTIVAADGEPIPPRDTEPDAYGQAALLLTESLLHALVETASLSNADAIGVIRTAAEVKVEVAKAARETKARMHESLAVLYRMAASFAVDPD